MVEKILNNTTPFRKIRASHEGSLHSSTLTHVVENPYQSHLKHDLRIIWSIEYTEIYLTFVDQNYDIQCTHSNTN